MFALQPSLFGGKQTLVVADKLMALDGLGDDPNQVSRGGGVDANVTGIGAPVSRESAPAYFASTTATTRNLIGSSPKPSNAINLSATTSVCLRRTGSAATRT